MSFKDWVMVPESYLKESKAKFSRRHYEFIASLFWQAYNSPGLISLKQLDEFLETFIAELKEDNPNFNEDKFRKAARSFQ